MTPTTEQKIEDELVLLVKNALARVSLKDAHVSLRHFAAHTDDDNGLARRVLLRAGFLPDVDAEDRWTSGRRITLPLNKFLNFDALVDVLDCYDPVEGFEDA